ncbi:hypothetical protein BMI86_05835 [Thioclava sp. DLFJ5-1]|nr:hypothetical protein BMI86_05835 [Thioclava sp. DLFJ5-1]
MPHTPNAPNAISPSPEVEYIIKAIDEKTDALMPLIELLQLLEKDKTELGKLMMSALYALRDELTMLGRIRQDTKDFLDSIIADQQARDERLSALEILARENAEGQKRILRLLSIPVR